jgi:uncharacterized protein (DUF924 family)
MAKQPADVLAFWFGNPEQEDPAYLNGRQKFWFSKSDETDATIHREFGDLIEQACKGKLEEWENDASSRLALILILDQFSRNCFRDTPSAFSQDTRALQLALEALENGMYESLSPIKRMFYLMPLEHAEDLAIQEQCVAEFEKVCDLVEGSTKETFRDFSRYAVAHRDVIAQFGRFPHRNQILGRESTPEEKVYLAKPGSGF